MQSAEYCKWLHRFNSMLQQTNPIVLSKLLLAGIRVLHLPE